MGRGLAGAIGGGVLGALIWGGLAAISGWEFGLVAWLIGGLVGGAAVALGGRGTQLALLCGAIAALSIVAGKFAAVHFIVEGSALEKELKAELETLFTVEFYEESMRDAREFANVAGEHEYPAFIQERGFMVDLEEFKTVWAPMLRHWSVTPEYYPEAKTTYVKHMLPYVTTVVREEVSYAEVMKGSFGLMDLVFFGLGIFTAWGIVAKREDNLSAHEPYGTTVPRPTAGPVQPVMPRPRSGPGQRQPAPGQQPPPAPTSPSPPPWEQGDSNSSAPPSPPPWEQQDRQ